MKEFIKKLESIRDSFTNTDSTFTLEMLNEKISEYEDVLKGLFKIIGMDTNDLHNKINSLKDRYDIEFKNNDYDITLNYYKGDVKRQIDVLIEDLNTRN